MAMALAEYQQCGRSLARAERGERSIKRQPPLGDVVALALSDLVETGERHFRRGRPLPIEKSARGDAPKPAAEAAFAAPLGQRPPRAQQGVLRDVVSLVAGQAAGVTTQRRFMRAHQRAEGGEVAPRSPAHQFGFFRGAQGST